MADRAEAESDRRHVWRRRALLVALAVVLVGVVAELAFWGGTYRSVERFELQPTPSSEQETVLLIGSDSRAFVSSDGDRAAFGDSNVVPGERADLVLVVQRTADGGARVLSLPRDLLVRTDGGGETRLALLLESGPQAVVDVLCQDLGLGVDHVVIADFEGLRDLVDAVGGIDVDIDVPLRDSMTGLDQPAGLVHLDGRQALAYVRSRQAEVFFEGQWIPEPDGAAARQERALAVVTALAGSLPDPWPPTPAVHRMARTAAGAVRLSDTLGWRDLRDLESTLSAPGGERWQRLEVDETQVGDVPIGQLGPVGRQQLADFGRYPFRCGG